MVLPALRRTCASGSWISTRRVGAVHYPFAWIRTVALRQHDHPSGMHCIQPVDDVLAALTPYPSSKLSVLVLDLLDALRRFYDNQAPAVSTAALLTPGDSPARLT